MKLQRGRDQDVGFQAWGSRGGPGLLETMGANLVAAEFVSFVWAWDFGLGPLVVSGRSSRAPWEW